jgi:class 3 adenylate cyclase
LKISDPATQTAGTGTAGLEHRIGGLEKADGRGSISYDPDNHDRMTERQVRRFGGRQVKTTGDAYMVISGAPEARPDWVAAESWVACPCRFAGNPYRRQRRLEHAG